MLPRAAVSQDFPFKCAAGVRGGANASEQMSPFCAGLCPEGILLLNTNHTLLTAAYYLLLTSYYSATYYFLMYYSTCCLLDRPGLVILIHVLLTTYCSLDYSLPTYISLLTTYC